MSRSSNDVIGCHVGHELFKRRRRAPEQRVDVIESGQGIDVVVAVEPRSAAT